MTLEPNPYTMKYALLLNRETAVIWLLPAALHVGAYKYGGYLKSDRSPHLWTCSGRWSEGEPDHGLDIIDTLPYNAKRDGWVKEMFEVIPSKPPQGGRE